MSLYRYMHDETLPPTDVSETSEADVREQTSASTVTTSGTTTSSASDTDGDELRTKIAKLEQQLADMTAIAKRAQSDYITLKFDFDGYTQRQEQQKELMKEDNLVSLVKRLVPVFTTLKQMVQTLPPELSGNAWTQGVTLTYSKLLAELESLGVSTIIPVIGDGPDLHLHLPLGAEETETTLQGKIIKVLEDGYVYKGKDRDVVITPAKVVLGK